MDIKISALMRKKWGITDTKIFLDKEERNLEDIEVVHDHPCKGVLGEGQINVFFKEGAGAYFTLYYNHGDRKKAAEALAYMNKFVPEENKVKPMPSIIRRRCKLCGGVYSFTRADLERNEELRKKAMREAVHSVAEAFGGTSVGATLSRKNSEDARSKIIDYDRCPKCGSPEVVNITDEEFKQMQEAAEKPAATAISAADELKKFKELLDAGVITQEEFDAKKKQLLGL